MQINSGTQYNNNISNSNYIREIRVVMYNNEGVGHEFNARKLGENTNYDISFNINKNDKKQPNESSVTIYGLGEETRRKIEKEIDAIFIYAGYSKNSKLIGLGDISEISFKKDGPEIITTIKFQDGAEAYRATDVSKNIPAKTSVKDMLENYLLTDMKLLGSNISENLQNVFIETPMIFDGDVQSHLSDICLSLGLNCYIRDGVFIVVKSGDAIDSSGQFGNTAVLINSETGLVNSPEKIVRLKAKVNSKGQSKNQDFDVEFQSLLNPNINVGTYLKIESKFINSFAVVKEVIHSGSNYDSSFYSAVKAKMAEPVIVERKSRTYMPTINNGETTVNNGSILNGNYPITSKFGEDRGDHLHSGIDIGTPYGTPIYAPNDATVSVAGQVSGYGNAIYLTNPDGTTERFGHLSSFAVNKKQKVKRGDLIGYTGNTGVSSGPHLHYEYRDISGTALDPQQHGYFI